MQKKKKKKRRKSKRFTFNGGHGWDKNTTITTTIAQLVLIRYNQINLKYCNTTVNYFGQLGLFSRAIFTLTPEDISLPWSWHNHIELVLPFCQGGEGGGRGGERERGGGGGAVGEGEERQKDGQTEREREREQQRMGGGGGGREDVRVLVGVWEDSQRENRQNHKWHTCCTTHNKILAYYCNHRRKQGVTKVCYQI